MPSNGSNVPLWRRYSDWSARTHVSFQERHGHRFPGLRNRRGYRRIVLVEALFLCLAVTGAVLNYFTEWALPFLLIGLAGTLALFFLNRIVTGAVGDTPDSALDELQREQRHSARSISYGALIAMMFIPYGVLISISTGDVVQARYVSATAILLIVLVTFAAALPALLTAWWLTDPDPEDLDPEIIPTTDN